MRATLFVLWFALLVVLGVYVQQVLRISADLRLFMPTPQTPAQRLLIDEIGEGPASRLLLIALSGATPEALADTSQALVAALREDPLFRLAANGDTQLEQIPESLLTYRYLLSNTLDTARFDARFLREELMARTQDLVSPAGGLLKPWLPRDPTLEILTLAQAWQPMREPEEMFDVWFSADHRQALLLVETYAPGFDPDGQRLALTRVQQQFAQNRNDPQMRMLASGPGVFSVLMKERTTREAQWLGGTATLGMLLLLLLAYRSVMVVLLAALPLLGAGVAGLAAVSAVFGAVHGITLVFGFTLIGVAQDYPLHLFSHQHRGATPVATAHALWPTLATGVAGTCIAYLAFLFSGVTGLAQLACFTIVGLAAAALSTRYLLPRLLGAERRDWGAAVGLDRVWRIISALPRSPWLGVGLVAASSAVLLVMPWPLWEDNLATLTPVPKALLDQDLALRSDLGAPDVRYLLVMEGDSSDAVIARGETLMPSLDALVRKSALDGYDLAARYLPSRTTQERRRAALPDAPTLRAALAQAQHGLPFKPDVFEPFLRDVEQARALSPLTPRDVADTPLGLRLAGLLLERDGHWTGLVSLSGVRDSQPLARFAAAAGVTLLDLKQASEALVASYRERILLCLAVAALSLVGVVWLSLRRVLRVLRVLAPMLMTTLLVLGLLHGVGVSLSLFHLIALVLAAGLGLDYALFFEHAADDSAEQRRTLHAVLVCAASTLMVFALLAMSSLPVLRAIGVTVTVGVLSNFVLALLLTRGPVEDADARP